MNLKDQVVSLELATKLKELGVNQNSIFCYQLIQDCGSSIWPRSFDLIDLSKPSIDERLAAFTASELLEMLPKKHANFYKCSDGYIFSVFDEPNVSASTLADACAKMLIYLIENNLIEMKVK